jgi:hypothetical protein
VLNLEIDEAGYTIESHTREQGRVVGNTPMCYVEPQLDDALEEEAKASMSQN